MHATISPRPGLRPGAPAAIPSAPPIYRTGPDPVNRPGHFRPLNLSPSRLPGVASDVALWAGFLRLLTLNGHSYGGGYWGGN